MIEPIKRTVHVKLAPNAAFRLFTEKMGSWWPSATHTIMENEPSTPVFECAVGGRVYERSNKSGEEAEWGRVTVYDPPARVVFDFRPGHFVRDKKNPCPEVEIRFVADGAGTRVELEHRGWERLPEGAKDVRASYDSGWATVFSERFAAAGNAYARVYFFFGGSFGGGSFGGGSFGGGSLGFPPISGILINSSTFGTSVISMRRFFARALSFVLGCSGSSSA